jgi:hypothetical protein
MLWQTSRSPGFMLSILAGVVCHGQATVVVFDMGFIPWSSCNT